MRERSLQHDQMMLPSDALTYAYMSALCMSMSLGQKGRILITGNVNHCWLVPTGAVATSMPFPYQHAVLSCYTPIHIGHCT